MPCSLQLGFCSKLGVLSLRDNCVVELPEELGKLQELHVLNVSGNRYVAAIQQNNV